MKRSYNLIAPVYDAIATLFYGKALRKAQCYFLPLIPPSSHILIAGGGTGWILEEITKVHPHSLYIDYIDVSSKMITLSTRRNTGANHVQFIHQSILDFTTNTQYDVIITPFFFDNFKEETMQQAFNILHQNLKPNGLWLYTDFQITRQSPYWQKILLFTMYAFFRLAANIEASQLPGVTDCFSKYQYHLQNSQTFLHKFIITSAYRKQSAISSQPS